MSEGLTPSCSSCAASVFGRRQCARIGGRLAVRHGGDGIGKPGVPQEPALRVLDQVAVVDEIHRLADVHARRPARNVAGNALAAIEEVEPLDALGRLGEGGCVAATAPRAALRQAQQRWFHDVLPDTTFAFVAHS